MSIYVLIQQSLHRMRPLHMPRSRVQRRKVIRQSLRSFVLISLGALSAFVGLKGFLLPNHLIDGGATGISILTAYGTPLPLPLLILMINIPFIFMGWRQVGLGFALRASGGIILLSILLSLLTLPTFTSDRLLIAVFGGFFLGAGIGLSIRGGGVIDGTEVLALYISRKTGLTIGDFILVINILIFLTAAWLRQQDRQ